ncbi:MAG: heavy metal-binding domain-containing protein [Bacteroidales bacterium]|nr:heavy metal-binding domain-containing protein [Bacteroidales bacterium]
MSKLKDIFKAFGANTEHHKHQDCCGGAEHSHQEEDNTHLKTTYQCPMKCEGDKTYNAPGRCPVCNMHLTPVG